MRLWCCTESHERVYKDRATQNSDWALAHRDKLSDGSNHKALWFSLMGHGPSEEVVQADHIYEWPQCFARVVVPGGQGGSSVS